jgi:hypothetical protein
MTVTNIHLNGVLIYMSPPSRLARVLQYTLRQLEKNEKLQPSDPVFVGLRNSVTHTIAELEIAKQNRSTVEPKIIEAGAPVEANESAPASAKEAA